MKRSRPCGYALRALTYLARQGKGPPAGRAITGAEGLPVLTRDRGPRAGEG